MELLLSDLQKYEELWWKELKTSAPPTSFFKSLEEQGLDWKSMRIFGMWESCLRYNIYSHFR
jgi:hypothetical protein